MQGICCKQQRKKKGKQNKPYCNLFVQEVMKAGEMQLAVTCYYFALRICKLKASFWQSKEVPKIKFSQHSQFSFRVHASNFLHA